MLDPRFDTPSADIARQPLWSALLLVAWIILLVGLGLASGFLFPPDEGFDGLLKPTFQPPASWFGPVWTVLYVCMGVAMWRLQREPGVEPPQRRRALLLFAAQLALNLAWTPLFFGAHSPALAFVDICALWVALLLTVLAFGKIVPAAGYVLLPYLLWVSFALVLNGTIWLMNA